jgi:hypothetical protein
MIENTYILFSHTIGAFFLLRCCSQVLVKDKRIIRILSCERNLEIYKEKQGIAGRLFVQECNMHYYFHTLEYPSGIFLN